MTSTAVTRPDTVGSPEPIDGRCCARLNTVSPEGVESVRYCQRWPVEGRARCPLHGGLSLQGIDHPNYRGRTWAKSLPDHLAARYMQAMQDQELTGLRSEIGLLDSRVADLLDALPRREGPSLWDQLKSIVLKALGAAEDGRPMSEVVGLLDLAGQVIQNASGEAETWMQIQVAIELRRRLADTERKRDEVLQASMTAKQALTFFGALQVAIQEEVPDPVVRARLGTRVRKLLSQEGPTPPAVRQDEVSSTPAEG